MLGSRPMLFRICLSNTSIGFFFFLFSLTQGHTQSTNKLTDALFEQFYACIEEPYSQKTENELSKRLKETYGDVQIDLKTGEITYP